MKKLKLILILCATYACFSTGWGQTYSASPTTTSCYTPLGTTISAGGTYYRGYTKVSATFSGSTATFTLSMCTGTLPASTSIKLRESTSSSLASVLQGSTVKTVTSGSAGSSYSFTYSLPFTSGTRYYSVVATVAGLETCTEVIGITATTSGSAPTCSVTGATNITVNSATLNGKVNPNGSNTSYLFQYSTNVGFPQSQTVSTDAIVIGSGTSNVTVSAPITGLGANKHYYYRIMALNSNGSTTSSYDTFDTPFDIRLSAAMSIPSSMVVGQSYTVTIKVLNNTSEQFSGCFYLKDGNTNVLDWSSVTINSSGVYTLTKTYTPTTAGTKTLTLYHQANCSGSGVIVGAGSYSNPVTVTIGAAGSCSFPSLPTSNDYYTATCYLYNKGILDGIITSSVTPTQLDNNISRKNMANIAFRGVYNGTPPSSLPTDNYPLIYTDLTGNDLRAIRALLYLEYDNGISPFDRNRIVFEPNENIARVHVLKVLLETFNIPPELTNTTNPFPSDQQMVNLKANNPLHFGYMRKAYDLGIIQQGNPFNLCMLGESLLMLYRIMTTVTYSTPQTVDYFEPLNITLANLAVGLDMELGNFNHYSKTSFSLDGVVPLDFTHTYNSYNAELPNLFFGMTTTTEETGEQKLYMYQPLGPGWSHTYHSFITQVNDKCIVHWGGGTIHIYKTSGSQWVPESIGVYDELSFEGSTIVIKTKSQIEYRFKRTLSGAAVDGTVKLWTVKDRNGNTLTINYGLGIDNVERITSVSDGNRNLSFSYKSGTNLISKVSDPLGREISFGYAPSYFANEGCTLSAFKDATNNSVNDTRYFYVNDAHAKKSKLLSEVKLPKGNSIKNDYDAQRRLSKSVSSLNSVPKSQTNVTVASAYTSSSQTMSSTVQTYNGSSWRNYNYSFNKNNNITSITGNQSLSITASYSDNTNPILPTTVSSNSDKADIQYDAKGNVTKVTQRSLTNNSDTRITNIAYNSRNDVTSVTDPKGYITSYNYNSTGNLTGINAPENSSTSISVNTKGLPTSVTNPENIVTEYAYNTYGNLQTTTIPALSLSSTINYDNASRVTSVKDFLNRTTSFTYDVNDNLLTEKNAANHTTTYAYDVNDNLTTITNAKNGITTMTYDNTTDWLTSISFGGATKQYEYNDDGTLKKFTKADNTQLNSTYDNLGRITNDGVNTYTYDSNHRLATIVKSGKTLTFEYDGFNQMTGVTYSDFANNKVSYTYDANGNVLTMIYPGSKTVTYTYDNLNRMKTVKDWNNNTITYTYLKDSRLQSVSYPNGMTITYAYDNAGRQTGKTVKRSSNSVIASYSFTLDNAGNILTENRTEPYDIVSPASENVNYSYNTANRITQAGNTSFTFDANGNTKTRGSSSYNYDNLDKLTSGGGFSFEYDGLGNIRSNGTKRYMIDISGMGNVIAETNMSGTPTAYYIYGAGGLETRILSNGTTEYYLSDYRGSVVAMVDATTSANITHKYQYDDFGNITQKQESDENAFRYVGKYGVMYANDNLYYMRARFYDPSIGRFLSEDPIWSTNLYPYADNNPVMGIDPKGLVFTEASIGLAIGIEKTVGVLASSAAYNSAAIVASKAAGDAAVVASKAAADVFLANSAGVWGTTATATSSSATVGGTAVGTVSAGATVAGGAMLVGAAAGATLVGVSVYNGVKSLKNATNLTTFVNNMNKSGDPIYKVSQKIGNGMDKLLDNTLGKLINKKTTQQPTKYKL